MECLSHIATRILIVQVSSLKDFCRGSEISALAHVMNRIKLFAPCMARGLLNLIPEIHFLAYNPYLLSLSPILTAQYEPPVLS